jgi:hypothetical protein
VRQSLRGNVKGDDKLLLSSAATSLCRMTEQCDKVLTEPACIDELGKSRK